MNRKYGFAIPALTLALANMMYGQTLHPAGATVNGPLLVQPAVLVTPGVPVVTPGPGGTTALGGVQAGTGGDVIITQTLIDTTNNSQVVTGGGGASIQTNGDTQLSAPTSTTSTVNYGRAVRFEVAQAGNSNPVGLPIAGTEVYYLTNAAGVAVAGAPTFASQALLDAYIATLTPATMLALSPALGTQTTTAGAGGNLTVDGNTTTNGIDNSGEQITNVAAGVAPTDAANVGQVNAAVLAETTNRIADVNAEEARALAAEGILTTGLANEVTNRTNADTLLQSNIDAEALTRGNADTLLQNNINAEATTRANADGVLTTGLANEVTNRTNADTLLQNNINAEALTRSNADTQLQSNISAEALTRSNADTQLQSNINNEANQRIAGDRALSSRIDTNTRGIAMVAAMTNTSVAPGMKQAVDFNVANFEGETGFGLGYAYRVNENLQVQGAAASTNDMEDSVVRVGLSYQW